MGLIQRIFGESKQETPVAAFPLPPVAPAAPLDLDSQTATRRELVRMLTRDSLRISGIPDRWIESQMLLETGRDGQTFIHLRLIVKHWDEGLMRYVVAFQRRLRTEIERFEPNARQWLLTITWQYEVDDECPFLFMPDAVSWGGATPPNASAGAMAPNFESPEEAAMQSDLARLYALRDANLAGQGREDIGPALLPKNGAVDRPAT